MVEKNTVKPSRKGNKLPSLSSRFSPRFWENSDARISVVKTIRRRYQLLKEHCGGEESYQRDLLCQRVAFISIILETQEVQAAEGGDIDLGSYIQATNGLTGLLKTLGLDKRIKSVRDLSSYLKERGSE